MVIFFFILPIDTLWGILYHSLNLLVDFFYGRPFSEEELRSNAPQVVTCNEYQREVAVSQSIAGKHIDRIFTFDKVFPQKKTLISLI